jgi:DNA-binding NtrC family response regulator
MPQRSIRVLIVEDNSRHAQLMEEELRRMKLDSPATTVVTARAHCGEDALAIIRREPIDIVLLDYGLPDYDGLELLQEIQAIRRDIPVVYVTSRTSVKVAVEAMKSGACDYLVKDEQYLEMLPMILAEVIRRFRLRQDNRHLKKVVSRQSREINRLQNVLEGRHRIGDIVAFSPSMRQTLLLLEGAITSTANVLLEGETGTGKELLARATHLNGARRDRPFIAQNCAALPEGLLESELFGVVRGAFTGADRDRKGLFEEAHGGTLFLDEIGEMPLHLQAKLLRVIQEQEVRPLGSPSVKRIDVRIVAATNLDLARATETGTFRKDLFYRLSVLPIRVPPLRERREDIPHLMDHFLRLYREREGKDIPGFDPETMALLERYSWPGNVRQLENEIHRLVAYAAEGEKIGPDRVSDAVRGYRLPHQELLDDRSPLREILDRVEAQVVSDRLRDLGGNKTATAQSLGVNRETLYQKLAKHGITGPRAAARSAGREPSGRAKDGGAPGTGPVEEKMEASGIDGLCRNGDRTA